MDADRSQRPDHSTLLNQRQSFCGKRGERGKATAKASHDQQTPLLAD
jgi:hypothetical protein